MKKQVLLIKSKWILFSGVFLIGILSFLIILLPREIAFLKTISVLARYNTTRFLPTVAILLLVTLSLKESRLSTFFTACVIFPVFALALNGLWAGAYSENNVIAGLIPRSDAFGFYGGSVSFLESGFQISIAKRRPLFGGFLAFILWLTGGNLQITLAIIAFLKAMVCFFSVIEVKKSLNSPAAILYFIILFLFIRRFIGITMSETMGIILGVSSMACMLIFLQKYKRIKHNSTHAFLLSVLLFSLSQAARPGAVIVLPLLIIFAGWLWRETKRPSWKWVGATAIIIITGFLLNTLIFSLTTPEGTVQMNNIGYGIYGLAVGGKGWEQIFYDHPEIDLLQRGVREKEIIRIIIEEATQHPENLIKGLINQFKILFSFQSTNSIYSFVWSSNNVFNYGLISIFFLLFVIGVVSAIYRQKQPLEVFILLLTIGFILSLPFAPAYQTQYMRVYAASIPFLAILPAFGLYALLKLLPERIQKIRVFDTMIEDELPFITELFSTLLIAIIITGPLLVRYLSPSDIPAHSNCPEGQSEAVVRFFPGSSIYIYKNTPDIMTWVPNITQLDYKGSIHNICCGDEIHYFENIPVPNSLYPAVNLIDGQLIYIIADETLLPDGKTLLHVCGRIEDVHKEISNKGFLYPQTITPLD